MMITGRRSRRARGPRQRAVGILAAVCAIAAALSTTLMRTTRGVRHEWFANPAPWLLWVLGCVAVLGVIAAVVLVVARSRDGVDSHAAPEAKDDDGVDGSGDDLRRKKMVAVAIVVALITGLLAATIGLNR